MNIESKVEDFYNVPNKLRKHKNQIKMNLEHLIENAIIDVKYYQGCLREAETKLDAFYIAQDAKSDNPLAK
jgi:hypothetical protein